MLLSINYEITKILSRIKINNPIKSKINDDMEKPSSMSFNNNSKMKSNDPRCLLNSQDIDIPRNKRCPVTNMKYKQCCGKM